ncbi:MAG: hybrid sensor histidine kinase/response regulator [Cyanobacteria bacterium J06635_15]
MVIPSLAEFLIRAPSCAQGSNLQTLLDQCHHTAASRSSQYCVLLHSSGRPVSCVGIAQVLAYISDRQRSVLGVDDRRISPPISALEPPSPKRQGSTLPLDTHQPLQQAIPHLIEAIGLLSAQTPLDQVWSSLRQRQVWVLVDAQQHYLGLLDSWAVLKFLADGADDNQHSLGLINNFPRLTPELQAAEPITPMPRTLAKTSGPTWVTLVTAFADSPLPVMFQSSAGQILSRNLAWEKHFGTWKPWQSAAASNSGTALAVSIAHQDELGLGSGNPKSRSHLDIDIRQTRVCDINEVCGQWEIIRIPILTNLRLDSTTTLSSRQSHPISLELATELEALVSDAKSGHLPHTEQSANTSNETIWLCLGQPHTSGGTVPETWQQQTSESSANHLKDELLGCLNHELKSAITALLGLSTLLLDSRIGHLDERQTRYTRLIHHNAQNLKATVNEILDVTRAVSGQMALTPTPVDLETLIQGAITQAQAYNCLRRKLESGQALDASDRVDYSIQAGLEAIFVDELRVRQMLTHLLSNAFKYTPFPGKVGVTVERWSEWIAITVWDTGYGIDSNQQPLVFHRLQWLDNNISPLFLGPGVGLLLTRQLAHLQGGELTFQSRPGIGSQFTILLPYRSPKRVHSSGFPNRPSRSSRLAVLIDTDVAAIAAFSKQLQDLGYRVAIARSSQEAIDKTLRLRPCAVFLRPAPTLERQSVLQHLRQHDEIAELPIITLSTHQSDTTPLAQETIETPISNESLREILQKQTAVTVSPTTNLENTQLTVLYLKPPSQLRTPEHESDLSLLLQHYDCRILEVDDIEQADLLVLIWKPKVVLLDPGLDQNPMTIFQQISCQSNLATLPLVTLTGAMTQAANSFSNLAVYPYLAPLGPNVWATAEASPLIDVLNIAATQGGVQ